MGNPQVQKGDLTVVSPHAGTLVRDARYAKDGKVVCFFQGMENFRTRYAMFGFMHEARLDEGTMWPTAFALKKVTAAEEEKIAALVKKAAG
jgi:hypothetical protein